MVATNPPLTVRKKRKGDADPMLSLARTLGKWFDARGLAQMERDFRSHAGFVALAENRLLGFITWNRVDEVTADLSWMGVVEDLQHRGIGTALFSALMKRLRREGFRYLVVSTIADSVDYEPYAKTRRFYRAMGMKDYRVDPRYFGEGDDRYDRLLLRLDLTR